MWFTLYHKRLNRLVSHLIEVNPQKPFTLIILRSINISLSKFKHWHGYCIAVFEVHKLLLDLYEALVEFIVNILLSCVVHLKFFHAVDIYQANNNKYKHNFVYWKRVLENSLKVGCANQKQII